MDKEREPIIYNIPSILIFCIVLSFCTSLAHAEGLQLPTDAEIEAQRAKNIAKINEAMPKIDGKTPKAGTVYGNAPADQVIASPKAMEDVMQSMQKFNAGKQAKKVGSDLMVFASFSMPTEALVTLSHQVKEAGGVIVLRGILNDGWVQTMKEARAVNQGGAAWEINSAMFKKFKVTAVPAFVLADASKIVPSDEGCASDVAYASVVGDISVEQALGIIKTRGAPQFAKMAEVRINKIRSE
jgi:type-F conjugative transfer system pilin assembly protein TrbC